MLKGKTVVLGVTGSIAAYKIANLASMLVKQHCDVHVIMTKNATNFINPIAFETLTNNKCLVDTFDRNFQYSVDTCHQTLRRRLLIAGAAIKLSRTKQVFDVAIFQIQFQILRIDAVVFDGICRTRNPYVF